MRSQPARKNFREFAGIFLQVPPHRLSLRLKTMKTTRTPRILGPAALALALTFAEPHALRAQSPEDARMPRSAHVPDFSPLAPARQPGNLFGVDVRGGFLKISKPGRANLIADGGLAMYDMAISKGTAFYVSSNGYLYRSNLRSFRPTEIGYTGNFNALDFSPSGKLFAMGANSHLLHRIDPRTGKAEAVADVGRATAGDLCFITNQVFLFTSTDNKLVKVNLRNRANPSRVLLNLDPGSWYAMDYHKGRIHLIDNASGDYYVLRYPNLRTLAKGNIYRNPSISGCNGISFR